MKKIFIGYDPRQIISYTVLSASIIRHASEPVSISPLVIDTLPVTRQGLTPFTYSRFLVPFLCDYVGEAVFLDADILLRGDICRLFDFLDGNDIAVRQSHLKFEWASVMVFDNARCRELTPELGDRDWETASPT